MYILHIYCNKEYDYGKNIKILVKNVGYLAQHWLQSIKNRALDRQDPFYMGGGGILIPQLGTGEKYWVSMKNIHHWSGQYFNFVIELIKISQLGFDLAWLACDNRDWGGVSGDLIVFTNFDKGVE